jgi:hypothetical protein
MATRRFQTNRSPRSDDPDWYEYDAEIEHVEPYRKKDKDGRIWTGLVMLPANTPVKSGDQIYYDDRWIALNHFEEVRPVSGQLTGYEVMF